VSARPPRRLAEEALTGNHGVKDQALGLLRSIDTEEFNQKKLLANRSFDAAEAAYRRREYVQARHMVAMIDARMLDAARQARLREISLTVEMGPGDTKPAPGKAVASDAGSAPADGMASAGLQPVRGRAARARHVRAGGAGDRQRPGRPWPAGRVQGSGRRSCSA